MTEWLKEYGPGLLAVVAVMIVVLIAIVGGVLIGITSDRTVTPRMVFIEVYEQHPAGLDETWYVVRWWYDGQIREELLHTAEGVERLRRLTE